MSVVHHHITGLDYLEKGLKNLRQSKMMGIQEFKDMFFAIEHHHRDLRLSHLTGKTSDMMDHAEKDTKFYNILVKMLCEIRQDHVERQRPGLRKVYAWYLANKHVLYSGPHFGKEFLKQESLDVLRKSTLSARKSPKIRHFYTHSQNETPSSLTEHIDTNGTNGHTDMISDFSDTEIDLDVKSAFYNVDSDFTEEDTSRIESQMLGSEYRAPSVKLMNVSDEVEGDWSGRQQKMIHSVSSIVNPHANPSLTLDPNEDVTMMSPGQKYAVKSWKSGAQTGLKQAGKAYRQSTPSYQDRMSARQQTRYHRLTSQRPCTGPSKPWTCSECEAQRLLEIIENQSGSENVHSKTGTTPRLAHVHEQSLEEFYQKTEIPYPFSMRKRPATRHGHTAKCSRKTKSAPSQAARNGSTMPSLLRNGPDTQMLARQRRQNCRSPSDTAAETNLKMDTIVSMIDSVSQEMVLIREQWEPRIPVGLLQPQSNRIATQQNIPQARTNTPVVPVDETPHPPTPVGGDMLVLQSKPQNEMVTRIMSPSIRPGSSRSASPSRSRQQIASPGTITPDTTRYKWSKTRFGGHTYLKKNLQRQFLRSAGGLSDSNPSSQRPSTAPVLNKQGKADKTSTNIENRIAQAASHVTGSVDQETLDSMMHIRHLVGTSNGESDDDDEFDDDFMQAAHSFSRSVLGMEPALEYVSFVMPSQENRSSSTSVQGAQGNVDREFVGPLVSFDNLVDSVSSGADRLDEQDINELEDELRDLCDEDETQAEDVNLSKEERQNALDEDEKKSDVHIEVTAIPSTGQGPAPAESRGVPLQPLTHSKEWSFSPHKVDKSDLLLKLPEDDVSSEEEVEEEQDVDLGYGQVKETASHLKTKQQSVRSTIGRSKSVTDSEKTNKRLVKWKVGLPQQLVSSQKWEFPLSQADPCRADAEKLLSEARKAEAHTAEVKYRSGLRARPTIANLRSQSAKVFSTHTKPTSHPEELFLDYRPKMTTHVERTAGRTPGSMTGTASSQVLRMARRQNEYFKRAPVLRTAPSIPTPHSAHGTRSPRVQQMFNPGLEHHARKENRPRQYMQQVRDLCRSDGLRSAPPILERDEESISVSLQVCQIRAQKKAFIPTTPTIHDGDYFVQSILKTDSSRVEDSPGREISTCGRSHLKSVLERGRSGQLSPKQNTQVISTTPLPLSRQGRPIAQYQFISDPNELAKAVQMQNEAAAAVDIQRIFRGYIARGQYKKLLSEERQKLEDQQRAAIEIQRAYRQHMKRKIFIETRGTEKPMEEWSKEYKAIRQEKQQERQNKLDNVSRQNAYNYLSAASKISVIGSHVDVYSIWHPKVTGPTKRELHLIAVEIQRHVRGWLVRKTMEKLRRKAVWNGLTFSKMVKEYKQMLVRVQKQHGRERAKTPFTFKDFEQYMDVRRRYESVFERKSFGGELDLCELEEFFRESDLHPSLAEIDEAIDVVFRGQGVKNGRGLKKKEVLEIVFYIYVPRATELEHTRSSTWMNPIIDGVEARKLLGSEFVEEAPLSACMKLVVDSKRERREQEELGGIVKIDEEAEGELRNESESESKITEKQDKMKKAVFEENK